MFQTNKITQSITIGILSLIVGSINLNTAQAQEPKFLLDHTCVDTLNNAWGDEKHNISINRQVYTSLMFMKEGSGFTCKIRNANAKPKYKSLKLGFGIQDDKDYAKAIVTVFLDGKQATTRLIAQGQQQVFTLPLKKTSNVAIEVTCLIEGCNSTVRFFQADLEPVKNSSGVKPVKPKR
jgi:hypothetical protein